MIELTKMNKEKFYLNPNLIEIIESTPDTLITSMSGKKYYVRETPDEVRKLFGDYYGQLNDQKEKKKTSVRASVKTGAVKESGVRCRNR